MRHDPTCDAVNRRGTVAVASGNTVTTRRRNDLIGGYDPTWDIQNQSFYYHIAVSTGLFSFNELGKVQSGVLPWNGTTTHLGAPRINYHVKTNDRKAGILPYSDMQIP